MEISEDCHNHTRGDGSWWEHDARGIPLCRVCDTCKAAKLDKYDPRIFEWYTQADFDEQIEEDY